MTETLFPPKPWLTIAYQPRRTMQAILAADPARYQILLVVVMTLLTWAAKYGLYQSLAALLPALAQMASSVPELGNVNNTSIETDVFSPLWKVPLLFLLGGWLLGWIGRRCFGGEGSTAQARAALSWSGLPFFVLIFPLSCWLMAPDLQALLLQLAERGMDAEPHVGVRLQLACGLLALGSVGWLVSLCRTLAAAHGFTSWRGLGTALLALLALSLITLPLGGLSFP
ncbi:YIP1 family protein [Ferrimonas pelagia]|uniref:Yip1 domain-containing protein n=1 Tax=Ferrimonas pelagia TaxID=1177826 RepID=A0ABP9E8G4_9GAMM